VRSTTSGLWHSYRLVAPGQPLTARGRMLLSLPRRIRADAAQGRIAVDGLRAGGGRHLVVFGDRPLDPTGDSASHRLGWLLRLAAEDGYRVSFYSVRERRWFTVGEDLGLAPADGPGPAGVAWVVRPEAAAPVMPALAALDPPLRVVYDTMDLHYLRLSRESEVAGSRGLALQSRLMRALEVRLCGAADVAVAITHEEGQLLRRLAPDTEVVVLPNVHEPRADVAPPLAERSGLLFVGNFTHTPNVDAVQVLASDVLPRLWERRPELVLRIAGRALDPAAVPVVDPRIELLDWVEDLDALVDSSALLVAPLRFGAGLKGKIGYAIARGLPVVTTTVGGEGFPEPDGMAVVAPGEWGAFAARTLELLADPERWARASAAGIELTRREYAPAVLGGRLRRILGG